MKEGDWSIDMRQPDIDKVLSMFDEKDAEIESLKREVAFMASNDYVYSLTSEIERLKALLIARTRESQ